MHFIGLHYTSDLTSCSFGHFLCASKPTFGTHAEAPVLLRWSNKKSDLAHLALGKNFDGKLSKPASFRSIQKPLLFYLRCKLEPIHAAKLLPSDMLRVFSTPFLIPQILQINSRGGAICFYFIHSPKYIFPNFHSRCLSIKTNISPICVFMKRIVANLQFINFILRRPHEIR
jgi:hypothetical protein